MITALASLLAGGALRHRDGRRHFWPWWTIYRYAVGHFLLWLPVPLVSLLAVPSGIEYSLAAGVVGGGWLIGCIMLWQTTLHELAQARQPTRSRRPYILVISAIPAILGIIPAFVFLHELAGYLF